MHADGLAMSCRADAKTGAGGGLVTLTYIGLWYTLYFQHINNPASMCLRLLNMSMAWCFDGLITRSSGTPSLFMSTACQGMKMIQMLSIFASKVPFQLLVALFICGTKLRT